MRIMTTIVAGLIALNASSSFVVSAPVLLESGDEGFITPEKSAEARVALDAMILSLRSIRSGTCRMHCRYQYDPNEEGQGKHSDSAENIFIAFDKSQNLYRYDDLETQYSGRPNQTIVRPEIVLIAQADWKIGGPSETRTIIRRIPSEMKSPFQHQRDPIVTVLADCRSNDLHKTHHGLLDRFLGQTLPSSKIVEYDPSDPRLTRVVVRHFSSGLKSTVEFDLTLNSTQDYVPVRVRLRYNGTKSGEWSIPDFIETEWMSTNGVYVPTRSTSTGSHSRSARLTFDLDWKLVNEAIHPSLFSEDAFATRKGDRIVLAQADKHVVEKIVGVELPKLPPKLPDPPPRRLRFALILLANAIIVGAVFYFLRRRQRASHKS